MDEPLLWYEGAGTSDRRWLVQDQLGSVIAVSNASGAALSVNSYDEYGVPGSSNSGRFQYTGQIWLPEAQLYHYKARAYAPSLGRFLQSDPILYAGGMNLYAYVGNDPVNRRDPSGLQDDVEEDEIVVTGTPLPSQEDWVVNFGFAMDARAAGRLAAIFASLAKINWDALYAAHPELLKGAEPEDDERQNRCGRWALVPQTDSGRAAWDFVAPSPIQMTAVGVAGAYNYQVYNNSVSPGGTDYGNACGPNGCARDFASIIGAWPRTDRQEFRAAGSTANGLYHWRIYEGQVGEAGGVRNFRGPRGRGPINVFVHRQVCGG